MTDATQNRDGETRSQWRDVWDQFTKHKGALSRSSIFGGAIITEQIFKVNGIGQQLIGAIYANDLPTIQTLTFIFAVLIVFFNLLADVIYGLLDPRIRYD